MTQVVADAKQNGLVVYFGVTMETAPAWLWKKYPDARLVYNTGEAHNDPTQYVLPADGKPGPCWHHPGAREAGTRFIEAIGREIGKFDNIQVWNVWQEIGFWPMRTRFYRILLLSLYAGGVSQMAAARYQSIQNLNDAWKSAFDRLGGDQPPRSLLRFHLPSTGVISWMMFISPRLCAGKPKPSDGLTLDDVPSWPTWVRPTSAAPRSWRYAEVWTSSARRPIRLGSL